MKIEINPVVKRIYLALLPAGRKEKWQQSIEVDTGNKMLGLMDHDSLLNENEIERIREIVQGALDRQQ